MDCPSGSYGLAQGFFSPANCTLCGVGTFNPLTGSTSAAACGRCEIGTFAPTPGAPACAFCPLGTTTLSTGAATNASCTPCAAGTYQPTQGSQCLPCPLNSYSTLLGSTSPTSCLPCPDNGSTDTPGIASLSSCKAFKCGFGKQPATPTPRSDADCAPISCPPPLSLALDGSGCAGCPRGRFGSPPTACAPCGPNYTCSGFFTLPVLASPAALASGASPTCVSASRLPPMVVTIPNQPASFTLASLPPLVTLCAALALTAAILSLLAYVARAPAQARLRLDRVLKGVDSFSLAHIVPAGSPLLNHPTALGGACTLLSLVAFFALSTVLVLQNAYANVAVQTALNTLLSSNPFSPSVKFAAPAAASPLAPTLRGGVQVRVYGQEGLGCNALAEGSPMLADGWVVGPPTFCGDGRTLLVMSCPACAFTAASTLQFYLPYTCQAFFMEAVAVDSLGVVNSVAFPPEASAATPTALLASLTWTVQVLGTILQDKIKSETAQGFQLFVTASGAATTPVGASIIPSLASIAVTIALPLQPTYSATLLQPRQTLVELFSSIVGLLGIIGLFRMLFLMAEFVQTVVVERKRRASAAALTGGEPDPAIVTVNPLAPTPSAPPAADAAPVWQRHSDGGDVWFSSSAGDTAWELPPGAVLASTSRPSMRRGRSSSRRERGRQRSEPAATLPGAAPAGEPPLR